MKKKLIENTPPLPCPEGIFDWWTTVQLEAGILILDTYHHGILYARHGMNVETGEHATYRNDKWSSCNICDAIGLHSWWITTDDKERHFRISERDRSFLRDLLEIRGYQWRRPQPFETILGMEEDFDRMRREKTEMSRVARVNRMMSMVPQMPDNLEEWIDQRRLGGENYILKAKDAEQWSCSACGQEFTKDEIRTADGKKPRNKDKVICPHCGKTAVYLARKKCVDILTQFALVQPIDDKYSVVRHFDVNIYCGGRRKQVYLDEGTRIILFKDFGPKIWLGPEGKPCSLYHNQYPRYSYGGVAGTFDNKSNPANRRIRAGYLYDDGIEEAFRDTAYEDWGRLFAQMAAAGVELNYNALMTAYRDKALIGITELLFKGRFQRLLKETSDRINVWDGQYYGSLDRNGKTMEEVFGLRDRQLINRIREKNGGILAVNWMQWGERHHTKISEQAFKWVLQNNIAPNNLCWPLCRMTLEKTMNYLERQRKESYPGKSLGQVMDAYADYMEMCKKLKKDTTDEMIYRPRELKRRHDEAVLEIEQREAELKAEEYSRKFKEAESVLQEIAEKFTYQGNEYFIKVPSRIIDIVLEGRALHHCAGATDRYFDRIKQHETYICFLRKAAEPDTPFYTIEVEPGGTIRQHRGYLDEEPDIELIKPFLREWQQEIRKWMSKQDHELAAASAVKREENLQELREKNNTRVLNGLMEDFMEAAG